MLFAKLTDNSTCYTILESRLFLINSKIGDPSIYKALMTFATQEDFSFLERHYSTN